MGIWITPKEYDILVYLCLITAGQSRDNKY